MLESLLSCLMYSFSMQSCIFFIIQLFRWFWPDSLVEKLTRVKLQASITKPNDCQFTARTFFFPFSFCPSAQFFGPSCPQQFLQIYDSFNIPKVQMLLVTDNIFVDAELQLHFRQCVQSSHFRKISKLNQMCWNLLNDHVNGDRIATDLF